MAANLSYSGKIHLEKALPQSYPYFKPGKWPLSVDLVRRIFQANANNRLLAFYESYLDERGPNLIQRLFGVDVFITLDPENVKAILTTTTSNKSELVFQVRKMRAAAKDLLGECLFLQDGSLAKMHRDLLRKQFTRIRYHNLDHFATHVELLVARLSEAGSSATDLEPWFAKFTLDTTTALVFGESVESLRNDVDDGFGQSFDYAAWITNMRMKLGDLGLLYKPKSFVKACKRVQAYADVFVRKALDEKSDSAEDDDRYLFIRNMYKELGNRTVVRDELMGLLLAGRDTTACLLAWTFRMLVRHRDVLERLQQEIETVLGGSPKVDKAVIQDLPYLRHVVAETLRLYPSAPVNARYAVNTTVLPRGGGPDGQSPVLIRKGDGIGYSVYHMQRRRDIYGEDAREFRPERWEDGTLQEHIDWAYAPFNGGPRVCLGKDFALLEAYYVIIRIVQTFPQIRLPADEKVEPIGAEGQVFSLTVAPADGCRVQLNE
ncbi:MAG: hypothetical protein Q9162_001418 [Coniocarpon cinnabarinum]